MKRLFRIALVMAFAALGVGLAALMARQSRTAPPQPSDLAASAFTRISPAAQPMHIGRSNAPHGIQTTSAIVPGVHALKSAFEPVSTIVAPSRPAVAQRVTVASEADGASDAAEPIEEAAAISPQTRRRQRARDAEASDTETSDVETSNPTSDRVEPADEESADPFRIESDEPDDAVRPEASGSSPPAGSPPRPAPPTRLSPEEPTPNAADGPSPAPEELPSPPTRIIGEGDDQLSIYINDRDVREVLAALSEQGSLNILVSKSVVGTVSANLNKVSLEGALEAILRSTGYVSRRDGEFIYVGTPEDFQAIEQSLDTVGTRVYRPSYVAANEIVQLVTPLLSPIGRVQCTTPAASGIQSDTNKVGGDTFSGADAVVVQDYEAILQRVDQIVEEVDCRPAQVSIESMILSVKLDNKNDLGVDFQFLRNKDHIRFATGSPLADLGNVTFDKGGLKFAFLDSSLGAFLSALETVGDTNVIATPRVMVLNKQRAEILIGAQKGYVSTTITETSTAQSVQFLETGTQLRLRPFISNDGMIRMEVHPELSSGTVNVTGGFTLPEKEVTQVTTNVMVPDGATVIIGGLMREELVSQRTQVPWLGSLPYAGWLFRTQKETIERREILVLITPRVVCDGPAVAEGEQGAAEFHRRQEVQFNHMMPLGNRFLGRKYYRMAQEAWARGDGPAASRFIQRSVNIDPSNRAAIDLRADIWAGTHDGDHSTPPPPYGPDGAGPLDGEEVSPWVLDEFDGPVEAAPMPAAPRSVAPDLEHEPARLPQAPTPGSLPGSLPSSGPSQLKPLPDAAETSEDT